MPQDEVINIVVLVIVIGALVIGLISMLIGRIVDTWDALSAWWGRGVQKAIHTRPVKPRTMSSQPSVPISPQRLVERRSYAVEQGSEQAGTEGAFQVPTIAELLERLSEDDLLAELARMKDASGNPKYADSRIAKFIGGRVEDRIAQVRDVRSSEPPPPKPQALLRVRDNGMERLIAKYGK
jgi:hypothetical protein